MDQGCLVVDKVELLHFNPDPLDVERGAKLVTVLLGREFLFGPEKCPLNGQPAVGDDARAGKLAAQFEIHGPGLELVIGIAELFRGAVAADSAGRRLASRTQSRTSSG